MKSYIGKFLKIPKLMQEKKMNDPLTIEDIEF